MTSITYKEQQKRLENIWNDLLSEESESVDVSEYEAEGNESDSSSSSGSSYFKPRKRKAIQPRQACQEKNKKLKRSLSSPSSSTNILQNNNEETSSDQPHCENVRIPIDRSDMLEDLINRVVVANLVSSEDKDERQEDEEDIDLTWGPVTGQYQKDFPFTETSPGIVPELYDKFENTPYDFYKMIIDDELFGLFVTETNRYATQERQKKEKEKNKKSCTKIYKWKDTNEEELEKFLGILM